MTFDSPDALQRAVETDLCRGRALVPERREVVGRQRCRLTLVHPVGAESHSIEADAVWSNPAGAGVGLEFVDWDETRRQALRRFADSATATVDDGPETDGDECEGSDTAPRRSTLYDRIRRLKHHEQQQLARAGGHAERIALERCFGGAVWEALLQNPQISAPEVANIAKKGSLPRPALMQVVANGSWTAIPEVQRALLGNPRLDPAGTTRILRLMPRSELTKVAQQARYPGRVRAEAKRLLST